MNFIADETAQKLRGGYYTPLDLATFLTQWVGEKKPARILEPSCGDGIFFEALSHSGLGSSDVLAFELNAEEAMKATQRAREMHLPNVEIRGEDFLEWALFQIKMGGQKFDAVVGNPPFVRYQYLPKPFQECAESIFLELGLNFTKHTNAWVPFILASMELLNPGGRLAMVVPAEIIHVTHAQSLRTYLGSQCRRLVIVDPEELWFSDTLQGAVILLAEKHESVAEHSEGLGIYPVRGREFLDLLPARVFDAPRAMNGKTVAGKWTRAILNAETRDLFDEVGSLRGVHAFKDVAKVDVGIVTGANKFFLVSDEVVDEFDLGKWAHPMFGRSEHCPGIIYDQDQHLENARKGNPTNFLWFPDDERELGESVKSYIQSGESQELHTRYKCRIRAPWYRVPSVYSTEIGMLKRSHDTPRMILNRIGAYTTDTAYRIRALTVEADHLVGCFLNPLTALSAELESRHYGGGVLELIPSEIERLVIPIPEHVHPDVESLDKSIRTMPAEQVLEIQGKSILGALGISTGQQELLLDGWRKLRNRRQRIPADLD